MKKKKRSGAFLFGLGVFFLLLAVGVSGYQIYLDRHAGEQSEAALTELNDVIAQKAAEKKTISTEQEKQPETETQEETEPAEVITVDHYDYCGVLSLDPLGMTLPILNDWSYPLLQVAPCRYAGAAHEQMVIAAHNYRTHFGRLKELKPGDRITFTDAWGYVYTYEVKTTEELQPTDGGLLLESDYDLTLFTCTIGGKARVVVRCDRIVE